MRSKILLKKLKIIPMEDCKAVTLKLAKCEKDSDICAAIAGGKSSSGRCSAMFGKLIKKFANVGRKVLEILTKSQMTSAKNVMSVSREARLRGIRFVVN